MSRPRPPLRIVFCGCDGLFSGLALRQLLARSEIEVVAVVRSTRILRARFGFLRGAWRQIRLSGLLYSVYLWIVTTGAEALLPVAQGRLVRRHRIPTLSTRNLNDATGLAFVAAAQPDVLVCAFFNQRVGKALLALSNAASVNIHPSLLPVFKGVDPVFFARLSGTRALGVTIHHLGEDFDTGDILLQEMLPANLADSLLKTTARLFDRGGHGLAELLADDAPFPAGIPQTMCGGYDSWPSAAQVRQLRGHGVALWRTADLTWVRRLGTGYDDRAGAATESPLVRR